jgi:ferredoxin
MLGGVVTTADPPEWRSLEIEEPGCPPDRGICVDACPVQAISSEERRVRIMSRLRHTSRTPHMSRLRFFLLSRLRPEAAARFMSIRAFDEHMFHVCSECVGLCPCGVGA